MKKAYVKPTVSKLEVDRDIIRMLTKQGFADLFWECLQETRKIDPCTTQEAVFDVLNEKYFKAIGCLRYSCFDSFRIVRDKKNDAHQTRK
jgi:hypothetical protein